MGLHGSRQGEKERQSYYMDISFLLLIHFIYSGLMMFCDSINLKVPSIFFLYCDFASFFRLLTLNRKL